MIHVGAAADELPAALVSQLAVGGRMVVPVGPQGGAQYLMLIERDARGDITEQRITGVQYVPLVRPTQ